MSLRVRLAVTFAFVALITAGAVALVTPSIVGRGFALIEAGDDGGSTPRGGQGPGPMAGRRAQEVQRETTITLIVAALVSAMGASVVGFLIAGRLTEPLERLGVAAAAVAQGDLERRSGLADRGDEIGSLGRSFDAMADSLEQAAASRQRFFQDVVHELKTPLTVIETTTTAVLDGVYAHEDRHLQTIRDQSRLLTRTVDDLRTISRAEAGRSAAAHRDDRGRPAGGRDRAGIRGACGCLGHPTRQRHRTWTRRPSRPGSAPSGARRTPGQRHPSHTASWNRRHRGSVVRSPRHRRGAG